MSDSAPDGGSEGDAWFTIADAESEASLRDQLRGLSLSSALPLTAAFCFWNGSPRGFTPAHMVLQQFATLAEGGGSDRASVPAIARALRSFLRAYTFRGEGRIRELGFYARPIDERLPERSTMRAAARVITNPGSPGQMLRYVLQKFDPCAAELQAALGFSCRDACTTVRIVLEHIVDQTAPYFVPGIAAYDRQVGTRQNATSVETPPASFLADWIAGSTYPSVRPLDTGGGVLNPRVIEFLTAEPTRFALPGPSFGRWAFALNDRAESTLLVSSMLTETLLSALNMGLLASLGADRQGAIGSALGDHFEELVANQFSRLFPPERVRQRVRRTPNGPEADFVVGLASGEQLVVQCRGRALSQRGRWGDPDRFSRDIEANIVEAAEQARRYLFDNLGGPPAISVLIVLDAYIPLAPFYTGSSGPIGTAVRDLPLPCVLSYYDLEYLMTALRENQLKPYLEWRGALLANRSLVVHDEFDAVRAFLRLHDSLATRLMNDRRLSVIYTGFDPNFEEEMLREADSDLGLRFADSHPVEHRAGAGGAGWHGLGARAWQR
jgi:hypothetical protein